MKAEERIRRLAAAARREPPPQVDVADRVMRRLRRAAAEQAADIRPFAWVAGLSAAVALPLAAAAFIIWQAWSDPLVAVFTDQSWNLL